ncbi:hypothetical protein O1L68_40445 [Streptomyces lydicus]|nr:hypothetical protein [Streptomyces lydicus]
MQEPGTRRLRDHRDHRVRRRRPRRRSLLNGCPQAAARRIFDEVTEAYITGAQATRIQARNSTLVRDLQLPYTSHRRAQARRAEHERRGRNATGLDRLRHLLTIPAA